jgi:Zn-finger domain-containing protein
MFFPNIKKTRSQIMNHMKYIYTKKSYESSMSDKVQSSYIECTLKKIKQPIPKQ